MIIVSYGYYIINIYCIVFFRIVFSKCHGIIITITTTTIIIIIIIIIIIAIAIITITIITITKVGRLSTLNTKSTIGIENNHPVDSVNA